MNENETTLNAEEQAAAAALASKPEAPKLTHAEKLVKRAGFLATRITSDTEEYNNIKRELDNAEALRNLSLGSVVQIKQGRKFADKDTTRIVDASIVGIQEQEDGSKLYKATVGEGFDMTTVVINAGAIISVTTVAQAA